MYYIYIMNKVTTKKCDYDINKTIDGLPFKIDNNNVLFAFNNQITGSNTFTYDKFNEILEVKTINCTDIVSNNILTATMTGYSGKFHDLHITEKLTVDGLIDPTGIVLTPQSTNPSGNNTIWIKTSNNHFFRGPIDLEELVTINNDGRLSKKDYTNFLNTYNEVKKATSSNVPNTIVKRDQNGKIQVGNLMSITATFKTVDITGSLKINGINVNGETGPTGPTGPIGKTGVGKIGPTGPLGKTGPIGKIGPTGTIGPMGIQGLIGPTGSQGDIGFIGPIGPTGQGITGPIGPFGPTGPFGVGPTGPFGFGATGPMGDIGPTGPPGAGPTGMAGPKGDTGVHGTIGPTGPPGSGGVGSSGQIWTTITSQGLSPTQIIYNDSTLSGGNPNVSLANDFIVGSQGAFSTSSGTIRANRMYFFPGLGTLQDAAFRAGVANGTQWDPPNVGFASAAFGVDCIASGNRSFAEGNTNIASGANAHAEGANSTASGNNSHVEGNNNLASGIASHVEGDSNSAVNYAHAEGQNTTASGVGSHSEGLMTIAAGANSHAEGQGGVALGTNSHVEGLGCTGSGQQSHAEGQNNVASGLNSHAEGFQTTASGQYAHAEGISSLATGNRSHAEGSGSASGLNAHAEGAAFASGAFAHGENQSNASGQSSHAEGALTRAMATYSHTEGYSTTADVEGCHIMGIYGIVRSGETYSWQLAGGNALPGAAGDGISVVIKTTTYNSPQPASQIIANVFSPVNADYAEYFEWDDGNPNKERRVGYFVTLNNGKIILAPDNDSVIGITSLTSCIDADAAELGWSNGNLKDEYGSTLTQDCYSVPMASILMKYQLQEIIYDPNKILNNTNKEIIIDTIMTNAANIFTTSLENAIIQHNNNINQMKNTLSPEEFQIYLKKSPTFLTLTHFDHILTLSQQEIENPNISNIVNQLLTLLKNELSNVKPVQSGITNPDYDPTKEYIPRSQRPEWMPVGLLGKIYVRDNGLCKVGSKCSCRDGIAIPGNRWYILSRSSPNVIRVLFK